MSKFIIACLFAGFYCINSINAQSVIASAKGGYAHVFGSLDCEKGAIITVSIENKFNKYLSLGINGKLGGADYIDRETFWENNRMIEEHELNISNTAYAVNIYSKISFITTDDIILSLVPELGFYWMESRPSISFTDKINAVITHKNYNTVLANQNISFGLHLEGQYYLTDKINVLASIGWNNYNIGKSLNNVDLESDWNYKLNEKTDFLYFEIGITYLLFGKNILE